MRLFIGVLSGLLFMMHAGFSQDTFSIVALDSTTRQVGSAGASCLDLDFAGISNPAFLADLLPDTGVINTQSYFMQANQDNARLRMRAGDTPAQIIAWLVANDANNNPEFKQYGIVGFNGNSPAAAAHTGTSCINYKNHILGNSQGFYYAIQGNILKGQEILDSMETRFRNTPGTLACKLMAAMQGTKVVGADTRCTSENTSSLFAFLQVAQASDTYGNPSIQVSLKTNNGDGIEPIDSLQTLFDGIQGCLPLAASTQSPKISIRLYPNPGSGTLYIYSEGQTLRQVQLVLYTGGGAVLQSYLLPETPTQIQLKPLTPGIYFYTLSTENGLLQKGSLLIE